MTLFLCVFLLQSEKLTKREVEAKFCNFSLSTNSVSVHWMLWPLCSNNQPFSSILILTEVSPLLCYPQLQTLYKYIEQKGDLQYLAPLLTSLTKQKTAVTQLAKQGLKDLEELTALLRRLGVKLQVIYLNDECSLKVYTCSFFFLFCFSFNKNVSPL